MIKIKQYINSNSNSKVYIVIRASNNLNNQVNVRRQKHKETQKLNWLRYHNNCLLNKQLTTISIKE